MHALLEVERAMREALVENRDDDIRRYVVAGGFESGDRLEIYRHTFEGVLTTALRLSYPCVQRLVGEDFFAGAARVFIAGEPPRRANLDDYGEGFPTFLDEFAPARSLVYLPDVARLEWAVNRALHAEDRIPLDPQRMSRLNDALVGFVPHPSITLLRSPYPVDAIWRAELDQDDAALHGIALDAGSVWLLVERTDDGVHVQRMSEPAWRFTTALCRGQPLHAAIDEQADFDTATLLADHLLKGRFVDIRLG